MIFRTTVANTVFDTARQARKQGLPKLNVYQERSENHEAFEMGWEATDEQLELVTRWRNSCQKAGEALAGCSVLVDTKDKEYDHQNGVCKLVQIVIGGEEHDIEVLPMYKLKGADGEEFELWSDEFGVADDKRLHTLKNIVDGSYQFARTKDFIDPTDLIFNGEPDEVEAFKAHLAEIEKLSQWLADSSK